tara:strand:+ start:83 stop:421 length:339 start_codon:yes stop_codon:yes gene_type:complete
MKNSADLNSKNHITTSHRKKRLVPTKNSYRQGSDVLVSAVISPYLLTHLHQILQKSEYNAKQNGRLSHAANFAKLRKVLCLDARSMEDASAKEMIDVENDPCINNTNKQNVA